MRIFTIAQVLQFHKTAIGLRWELFACAVFQVVGRQIVADGSVVIADAIESSHRQCKACFLGHFATGFEFFNDGGVLRCIGEHCHVFPVLGCTAHHGRAANVNVLNGVFQSTAWLGHSGFEGVQIDDEQIDGLNAVLFQSGHVLGHIAPCQQAAVNFGMQCFDTAIQHFWKLCELCHFGHGQTLFCQKFGRTAC